MPINSRQKGKRTELELAHKLEEIMGWTARRTAQFCGSNGDSDVTVESIPQLFVESKCVEKLNVVAAMEQAVSDAKAAGKLPCLFHRRKRTEWLVTIRLTDLPLFAQMVETSRCMREEQNAATSGIADTT